MSERRNAAGARFLDWFVPGAQGADPVGRDPTGRRQAHLLVETALALAITVLGGLLLRPSPWPPVLGLAAGALLIAAPLVLRTSGSLTFAGGLTALTVVGFIAAAFVTGGLASPALFLAPLAPLLASRFFDLRVGRLFAWAVVVGLCLLLLASGPRPGGWISLWVLILAILFIHDFAGTDERRDTSKGASD